ncbi:NYN domain-containing protein [Salinicoccus sp. HZC-1]|uniref:NYN domain-containing protein n=1 Tax=Salinicoccus sp. HZC-1 TaxID=3385497 RepID=UPI00398A9632
MRRKKRRLLVVDGYNLIGANKELHRESLHSMEIPREKVLAALSEYQSVATYEIICVFDAYEVKSKESVVDFHGVTIVYTKEKETADEYIERFVHNNYHPHLCEISVVTSDLTEQNAIFAQGAYRISSREMWMVLSEAEKNISKRVDAINEKMPRQKIDIGEDVHAKLEKWRRGRF